MKRYISIFLVFVCLLAWISFSPAVPTSTFVSEWDVVRAEGNEDGATSVACLNLTTSGDHANKSATAYSLSERATSTVPKYDTDKNRCVLAICGGADSTPENETFSFVIYGYAFGNGPAELICEGDGVIGTQAVVKYPHSGATATNKAWADTINIDDDSVWIKGVSVSDTGNNRMCRINFDATGLAYIKVYFYDAGAAGGESGSLSVYGRFY